MRTATFFAFALPLSALAIPATAATERAQRAIEIERMRELSMVVTGEIDVDADGKVLRYALDHRKRLSPPVVKMLDGRIPAWRFAPMTLPDGQTHSALQMRLRVIAQRVGEERDMFRMTVRDAGFLLRDDPRPETDLIALDGRPRLEPHPHVFGTVYLAVRIGPDGLPLQVFTERVDPTVEGSEQEMAEWRDELARFTQRQSKRIRFKVPTTGPEAGQAEWAGRLPVAYVAHVSPQAWEWEVYYPGPETPAPWTTAEDTSDTIAIDLLPADTAESPEQARRLLTPLDVN